MSLDAVRNLNQDASTREEFDDIKRQGLRKYVSPWVRIAASGSYAFTHGLLEIPHVTSVLEASDAQGTGQAIASSVAVTPTVTLVSVANTGAARFFRVRAF